MLVPLPPMLCLASVTLLFGSIASAQQAPPAPDAGARAVTPAPPAPPNGRVAGHERGQEMRDRAMTQMRDFQIVAGGGFRGDARIAPAGMWWKNPDLVAKLNLSADQQKRMDEIFLQFRIKLIHMKASLEEEELLLEPLINANPPDSAKALAQISRIADTRADLEKANAAMLLGVRGVLTPDQWTKLQTEEKMHHRITMGSLGMPDLSGLTVDLANALNGAEMARLDGLNGLTTELTLDLPALDGLQLDGAAMKRLEDSLKTMKIQIPTMDLKLDELQKQLRNIEIPDHPLP